MEDGVVVSHQNDGCRVVVLAELGCHLKRAFQRHASLQRALTGKLDRRPISHGVGEWQA